MMISIEGANTFIKKFFEEHPSKDYWDCTHALAEFAEIDFKEAFKLVSNYASRKWGVK